ncbi:MAG: hypothetical protein WKF97_09635 [Chitinophagaceae bacterium]
MEDKKLTEEESLALITSMINTAKNVYYESGTGALLWGFTNLICFSLAYLDATVKGFDLPFNPFLLMIFTFFIQLYYGRIERKYRKARTYAEDVNVYVWSAFGICILILTLAGGYAGIGYTTLPVLLLFFGMPTFISGCISKFKPFIVGGITCWILSIIAFLYKGYHAHLLVAAGATAAWIIPGIILRIKYMKAVHVQRA